MHIALIQLASLLSFTTPTASCSNDEPGSSTDRAIYTVSNRESSRVDPNDNITTSRKNAITRAVAKASPAIVGINVTEVRQQRMYDPFEQFYSSDPWLRQFFNRRGGQTRTYKVKGLGSGFLISKDGYVLTNDHVAGDATEIIVTTTDGKQHTAKLIASDRTNDVALLKIDGKNFPYLKLGNSDDLEIGEWSIALGNPFGLFDINQKPTVTVGVISNTNVNLGLQDGRNYRGMVQTDAAISSGNSGGPLLNANGEVVGINSTIYSTATSYGGEAGSIGLGFAIPVNKVKKIVDDFMAGKTTRGAIADLGFVGVGLTDQIKSDYNIEAEEGVVIVQMYRNSIAERSGLEPGDVITSVDKERVRTWEDFQSILADRKPGDTVTLSFVRDNTQQQIKIQLAAAKVTGK